MWFLFTFIKCIYYKPIIMLGHTDGVALFSSDRWMNEAQGLVSLSSGLIVTIAHSVFGI